MNYNQLLDLDRYTVSSCHSLVIKLSDLERWLNLQANTLGGHWLMLMSTTAVVRAAFDFSCLQTKYQFMGKKVVDITHFRSLLVQLFVISILWIHFKKADSTLETNDAFNEKLNLEEFQLAVRTFCACYSHEEFTDEQVTKDFELLDEQKQGHISFAQVCKVCTKFIDPLFSSKLAVAKTKSQLTTLMNKDLVDNATEHITTSMREAPMDLINELSTRPTDEEREVLPPIMEGHSSHRKPIHNAMECVAAEIGKNLDVAQFVSAKLSTQHFLDAESAKVFSALTFNDSESDRLESVPEEVAPPVAEEQQQSSTIIVSVSQVDVSATSVGTEELEEPAV